MTIAESNGPVPRNIGRILKASRGRRGAVARMAGLSDQCLCDMLHGRRQIKICELLRIAAALGVEAGELLVEKEED